MALPLNPAQRALESMIDRLHQRGRLRVGSLVVTMFGDAIAPRGGRVALGVLQDLMGRLRVEPGALRTAMSRLASDGWVIREREGRNAYYRLAEEGRHAFDRATRRIYASGPAVWNGAWTVAIAPPNDADGVLTDAASLGFVRVNGNVYLRPETEGVPEIGEALSGALIVHGSSAEHPETFHLLWPSREIGNAYRMLIADFAALGSAIEGDKHLGGLDAMAARILLIHDWRRIVLRDPGLPNQLLPADWPGEEARALVRRIHAGFKPASEAWLDAAGIQPSAKPHGFS